MTADQKKSERGKVSRCGHKHGLTAQDDVANWIQSCPMKTKEIYTDNSNEFILKLVKIYNGIMPQAPSSNRNEPSGRMSRPQSKRRNSYRTRAKRTTRRMVGLCDGMLLLLAQRARQYGANGKTAFEKRYGQKFDGPSIPFGTSVEYIPITAKDKSRVHQFGQKTLKGIFLGYVPRAGRLVKILDDSRL